MSSHKQLPESSVQSNPVSPISVPLTRGTVPPLEVPRACVPAWLYSAILGNGRLLVCLDESGSIAQLFYPNIDTGPHVRSFLTGIKVNPMLSSSMLATTESSTSVKEEQAEHDVLWLVGDGWKHELGYLRDTAVGRSSSTHVGAGIRIEQVLAVHPHSDILTIELTVTNLSSLPIECTWVVYAGIDIGHRRSGNCCFFNSEASSLIFYAPECFIALACDAPVCGYSCEHGSSEGDNATFQHASKGQFSGIEYSVGDVCGTIGHDFGQIPAGSSITRRMLLCFGQSTEDVTAASSRVKQPLSLIEETVAWWQGQYTHNRLTFKSTTLEGLYHRSLTVLRLLTDSDTGGMIAAPEFDPDFTSSGGYGMCWPRDGAYISHALDLVGRHDQARRFYNWALRVQPESRIWRQRYFVNGKLAPTWGEQFDETGTVVWALCRHIQLTGDLAYAQQVFPRLVQTCESMQAALDSETGLAPISKDLWEEHDCISSYTCACTWGAFHELSKVASLFGRPSEAQRWTSAAAALKTAIEAHFWDATKQRFLRSIKMKVYQHEVEWMRKQPDFSESDIQRVETAHKTYYLQRLDSSIDSAILGLSVPYGVFSPDDLRMLTTAETIVAHLTSPVGGIMRYQGDSYRGGNPWVICTLWQVLQDLAAGQKARALDLYNWVLEHCTALNLLPEQVDRSTAEPCWVVPLGWSHAMFILATQALNKQGLLPHS